MRVSVVIPALNEEQDLPGLLEVLLAQTCRPDEILVVDAESTDRTSEVVAQWAQSGSPVRCIKGRRGGCGIGRNIGIKAAKNGWIALLDCGMLPPPSWLASLEAMHHQTGAPAVFGTCQYIPKTVFQRALCAVAWGSRPVPVVPCSLIDRSVFETIGYFREDLEAVEDQEWTQRFLGHFGNRCVMSEPVTPHHDVPSQVSVVRRKWLLYHQCAVRAGALRRDQILYLGGAAGVVVLAATFWQALIPLVFMYGALRGVYLPIVRGTALNWLIRPSHFLRMIGLAALMDTMKVLGFLKGRYQLACGSFPRKG
ncbi:MAG: glycosyltransferase [Nitrospiraceae bacterium]|nr:glycosyltransferase [Nitrospiraceae bacterium]